jgi:hypothetical protein
MIRSLLASKTAKLVAACVCPVAGTGALTVAVPQVRSAVHKATAPRAYAAPKTRVRPAAAAPCPEATPVMLASPLAMLTPQPTPQSFTPPPLNNGGGGNNPNVPLDPGGGGKPILPAVPEAATWAQMIVGFGLIGGAVRLGTRGATELA